MPGGIVLQQSRPVPRSNAHEGETRYDLLSGKDAVADQQNEIVPSTPPDPPDLADPHRQSVMPVYRRRDGKSLPRSGYDRWFE
jgi:hypothetical protein